jgi:hypothetical protein
MCIYHCCFINNIKYQHCWRKLWDVNSYVYKTIKMRSCKSKLHLQIVLWNRCQASHYRWKRHSHNLVPYSYLLYLYRFRGLWCLSPLSIIFQFYPGGGGLIYHYLFYQEHMTTTVVRSNPTHGEVYSSQHQVIQFISTLFGFPIFLYWALAQLHLQIVLWYRCQASHYR